MSGGAGATGRRGGLGGKDAAGPGGGFTPGADLEVGYLIAANILCPGLLEITDIEGQYIFASTLLYTNGDIRFNGITFRAGNGAPVDGGGGTTGLAKGSKYVDKDSGDTYRQTADDGDDPVWLNETTGGGGPTPYSDTLTVGGAAVASIGFAGLPADKLFRIRGHGPSGGTVATLEFNNGATAPSYSITHQDTGAAPAAAGAGYFGAFYGLPSITDIDILIHTYSDGTMPRLARTWFASSSGSAALTDWYWGTVRWGNEVDPIDEITIVCGAGAFQPGYVASIEEIPVP